MLPLVVPEVVEPDVLPEVVLPLVEPLPEVERPEVVLPEVERPEVLPEVERPADRVEALVVRLTPPELVVPPSRPFDDEPDDLPLVELPLVEPEVDLPLLAELPLVEPLPLMVPLVEEPLVAPEVVEPLVLPPDPEVEPPVVPWSELMNTLGLKKVSVLAEAAREAVVKARAKMARRFVFIAWKGDEEENCSSALKPMA